MPAALDMALVAGPTLAAMFDKLYNSCMDGQTSSSVYSLHGFVDEQREIADDSETKLVRRLVLTEFRSDLTSAASATHEMVVGRLVVRRNTVHQLSYLDSEFLRSRPTTTTATTSVLLLLTSAMSESGSEKMEYTLFAGGAQSTNPTVVRLAVTNINDSSQRVTTLVNSFALTSARFGSPYAGAGGTPSSTTTTTTTTCKNAAAGLSALSSLSTLSNNVSDLLKTETTLRQEVANLTELLWLTRQRRHQEEQDEARRQQKAYEMALAMESDSPHLPTTEEEEGGTPPRVLAAAEAESSSKSLPPAAATENPSPVNQQERVAAGGDHGDDDGAAVQHSSANATAADIEAPMGDEDMSSWQHVGAVSETEDPPAVPSAPPHDDSDWVCADPLAATAAGPDDASVSES